MNDLPEPFVPPEADLRDFPFTPMYRARLFGSAFHARATDAEWRAGVTLWLKAQDQVPAGSLPDDDIELCRLAELGRDLKSWRKIRTGALHGWVKCSDGRLYNKVVAEVVLDQWNSKLEQRERREKWREKKARKRGGQSDGSPGNDDPVPRENALKRQGEGQGQRQGYDSVRAPKPDDRAASGDAAQDHDPDPDGFSSEDGFAEGGNGELELGLGPPPSDGVRRKLTDAELCVAPRPGGSRRKTEHRLGKKAERLDPNWTLAEGWRDGAAEARQRHGLPPINLDLEAEKFRNYWHGKSGQAATKLDWRATWINWALRAEAPRGGTIGDRHGNQSQHKDGFAALIAEDLARRQD